MVEFTEVKVPRLKEWKYAWVTPTGRNIELNLYHDLQRKIAYGAIRDPALSSEENFSLTGQEGYYAIRFIRTIIAIGKHHAEKHPEIERIVFDVNKDDTSRIRLYDSWLSKHGGGRVPQDRKFYMKTNDHVYFSIPTKNLK